MNRMTHAGLRMAGILGLALGLLVLFARCDFSTPAEEQPLVIEAFLQTGKTLGSITLRTTRPLDAPVRDTTAPAIGATLFLRLDGQRVAYRADARQPGTYVPETERSVPPRVGFSLTAQWRGKTATAAGVTPPSITIQDARVDVPEKPVRAILVDSLRRDSLDIPAEQGYIYPIEVAVTWSADPSETAADSSYWIRAQLRPYTTFSSRVVDFFLQPEEVFRERTATRAGTQRRWTGVYAVPVESETASLPPHRVRVSLIRSGPEYAAFAASRTDPDRREPISNVQGAVGIAAAVALDSVRITIDAAGGRFESEAHALRTTEGRSSSGLKSQSLTYASYE